MERPGEVMPPQSLLQSLLEELQLVGHVALMSEVPRRGLRGPGLRNMWQSRSLKSFVQQRRLADAFAGSGHGLIHHHGDPLHAVAPAQTAAENRKMRVRSYR